MPATSFRNSSRSKDGPAVTDGAAQDIKCALKQVGLGATSVPNYEELQRLVEEREALLIINRAIGRHLNRDELFGALASCLQTVLPLSGLALSCPSRATS